MATLQIRSKGTITLPSALRKKYGLDDGESLTLVDLGDGSFLLVPKVSGVMRGGDRVVRKIKEAGITLDELFTTLDEERERYYREQYAKY